MKVRFTVHHNDTQLPHANDLLNRLGVRVWRGEEVIDKALTPASTYLKAMRLIAEKCSGYLLIPTYTKTLMPSIYSTSDCYGGKLRMECINQSRDRGLIIWVEVWDE